MTPLKTRLDSLVQNEDIKRLRRLEKWLAAFHLKATETTQVDGRNIILNGKAVVNFGSCNYLGLDQHPRVLEAVIQGAKEFGNHSGCSRIFSSHSNIIELEKNIAHLVGAEKAMICANVSQIHEGTLPTLFSGPDCVFYIDRYAHTSMYQAALIAKAKGTSLERVDITDKVGLLRKLKEHGGKTKVLLVDGIYSMHGHIPDFHSLARICEFQQTILYVDDAHGTGIRGKKGAGIIEEFGLDFGNILLVGSLQKGLGCFGGFIAGAGDVIELLKVTSKSYIFSGAIQPHAVHGALVALQICQSEEGQQLRSGLKEKSKFLRGVLNEIGFKVMSGDTPIVAVPIGDDLKTLMAGRKLFDGGLYLNSVLFPAVPRNEGLLRISLTASHSEAQMDQLVVAFKDLYKYLNGRSRWMEKINFVYEIAKSQIQGSSYDGIQK